MATENPANAKGTCFVVMGFGKKTDFETGRTLDLDKSYRNMIKPAVEEAGLTCIRADEIVHSGMIDVPMYEQLLNADVVIADLSTSNKNAFYELGIRHALRPFTTIVIAEDGIKTFPFDVNHVAIRQYHHLGEDIGFDEVMRFRTQLKDAVRQIMEKNPREKDSPVYQMIQNLNPPGLAAAIQAAVQQSAAGISQAEAAPVPQAPDTAAMTHSFLMQQVDEAQKREDWIAAKSLLNAAIEMKKQSIQQITDPYLLQRLALITYKSEQPSEKEALEEARNILLALNPATSNDTETLGLWGAIHKRLWQIGKNREHLNEAIRAYERGFYLRNDYYNGINYAYLLNERASVLPDPAWAIADYMQAQRVRQEVLKICEKWLAENPTPQAGAASAAAMKEYDNCRYWVEATVGEALIGLGEKEKGFAVLKEAYQKAPEKWMQESTEEQLQKLLPMLDFSPLRFLVTATEKPATAAPAL
jgi:tetratricopeptide (TPR) repeat protein